MTSVSGSPYLRGFQGPTDCPPSEGDGECVGRSVPETAVNWNNLRRLLVREHFIQLFCAYLHIKVLLPVSVLHMSVYTSVAINK